MRVFGTLIFSAALLAGSSALAASSPCPTFEPGHSYPWQTTQVMADDQYAEVYIDVDEHGRPLKCYIGKTNIPSDDRFWVCKAYLDDWHAQPSIENGKAVRGTIHRTTVLTGDRHQKADHEARKRFFREHPDERPECYPE